MMAQTNWPSPETDVCATEGIQQLFVVEERGWPYVRAKAAAQVARPRRAVQVDVGKLALAQLGARAS